MPETLLPTAATPITRETYVPAAIRAWKAITSLWPSPESVGVLWAHYALETGGGAHCYNYNIGNVKHVAGDGHDYVALRGVWEGITPGAFAILQHPPLGHLIHLDDSLDHQRAVGPGKIAVVFDPPHPASWFRAYASLEASMTAHFYLLKEKRYASAWPAVEAGNVAEFAQRLREKGYFTASLASYAAGMQAWFDRYLASGVFEAAMSELVDSSEFETVPRLPDDAPAVESFEDEAANDDNVMIRDVIVRHEAGCASRIEPAAPCDCAVSRA